MPSWRIPGADIAEYKKGENVQQNFRERNEDNDKVKEKPMKGEGGGGGGGQWRQNCPWQVDLGDNSKYEKAYQYKATLKKSIETVRP